MERPLLLENLPQVTFDDAAIYFSEEQWENLEDFQKTTYKDLIKEIYQYMVALGYRIPKPDIVSRIERGEEPCVDSSKKRKREEPRAEGSKDADPVIKVERESPEASVPIPPSEISSSQERGGGGGAPCPRCGMRCNNQCGTGFQWNAPGMYPGGAPPPMDNGHRKPYMPPSPTFYNGSPISPGYNNHRGEGMPHPTSPMAGYGNVGMVPLSPRFPGYRNVGDGNTTFPFPERPANPVFGGFEVNQPRAMGPPGPHMAAPDHEARSRKDPYLHAREAAYQDRRSQMTPCQACGTFCNNQCGANFQWEQRRLHHGAPGPMEANRYASPPNPYFSNGANSSPSFPNVRPPLRHGTPPANAPGNPAMMQFPPQYPGYRRPGDPNSPNIVHGRAELSPGHHGHHGGNAATASPQGLNQGGRYGGIMSANAVGNNRKPQSMSPLAATETVPLASANKNLNAAPRPAAQTVTSSDLGKGPLPPYTNKRADNMHYTLVGGKMIKVVETATPPTGDTGQPKPADAAGNKHSPVGGSRNAPSLSLHGQATGRENSGIKRPAPQQPPESGVPPKRAASPAVIILDCDEGKPASSPANGGSRRSATTTPTSKSASPQSGPIVIDANDEPVKTPNQDAKRPPVSVTISSIRSSGVFNPPGNKSKTSCPIIIIDDKDIDGVIVQTEKNESHILKEKNEAQSSTSHTPPIKPMIEPAPPPPIITKVQPPPAQQETPVPVNKVPMQSPIIVAGTGLANQPLPVNGNQSIMLTFPVTVGSSGIVLATPVNLGENQPTRLPISKNPPRLLQPTNVTSGNAKLSPMTVRPVLGQPAGITVSVPPGQAKPIAVNVNQTGNVTRALSLNNGNLQKVNGGTFTAVPVTAAGGQPVGQPIPLFVDPKSGLILTGTAVPAKDCVPAGIQNATVVAVNRGVVSGNVAPVSMGGGVVTGNVAPVPMGGGIVTGNVASVAMGGKLAIGNVNGLGTTTFFTVDGQVGIGNNHSVALASPTNYNKTPLAMNSPTIVAVSGGLGIGAPQPLGAPIANIASVSSAPTSTTASGQQNGNIIIRKVGGPDPAPQNPQPHDDQPVMVVERLFNCSECGDKFNSLENLTSHQAVHKRPTSSGGNAGPEPSKDSSDGNVSGGADDDSPTILYTTQGDDGSTVYVVTV
ncbi:uncharacterized protein PAF06_011887 [Gastrophryne carolinensis]